MALTVRIKLQRTATIMAALETSSARPALLEVGQNPNAFFVNVTKCEATAATAAAALLCPVPTHSHINCLLICCSTSKNSIPRELLPQDTLHPANYRFSRRPSIFGAVLNEIREKGTGWLQQDDFAI